MSSMLLAQLAVPAIIAAQTRASHPAGVSSIALPDHRRESVSLHGAIVGVRPWREGHGATGWWEVELAGGDPIDRRMFAGYADSRSDIPLSVGQTVSADVDCRVGGWHYVCSATVRDASNDLLFAVAGSGEAGRAPGFTVSPIPGAAAAPGAPRVGRHEYPLRVEHAGRSVSTDAAGGWVVLDSPDGRFAVQGSTSLWEGGPRVPEAVDYTTYAITRLSGPSSH
jgi:hypothetical protein